MHEEFLRRFDFTIGFAQFALRFGVLTCTDQITRRVVRRFVRFIAQIVRILTAKKCHDECFSFEFDEPAAHCSTDRSISRSTERRDSSPCASIDIRPGAISTMNDNVSHIRCTLPFCKATEKSVAHRNEKRRLDRLTT